MWLIVFKFQFTLFPCALIVTKTRIIVYKWIWQKGKGMLAVFIKILKPKVQVVDKERCRLIFLHFTIVNLKTISWQWSNMERWHLKSREKGQTKYNNTLKTDAKYERNITSYFQSYCILSNIARHTCSRTGIHDWNPNVFIASVKNLYPTPCIGV